MTAKCGDEKKCKEYLHEIKEGKFSKGKMRTVNTAA